MAMYSRMCTNLMRTQLSSALRGQINPMLRAPMARTAVTLKTTTISAQCDGHDERNMKLGRPQSPHLTIYAPQLTSMLSITHRFSGMILSAYAAALGVGTLVLPENFDYYIQQLSSSDPGVYLIAGKALLAFPFAYHICNGIRHLCWDSGLFLTIKQVYITGYIMVLVAIGLATGLSLFVIEPETKKK